MTGVLTFDDLLLQLPRRERRAWFAQLPRELRRLLRPWFGVWTTPRTWATGELVTDTMLNTHVRDNLNALNPITNTSYTVAWTSSGTQPAIGNGSKTGSYYAVGSLVFFRIRIVMGSTTTFGTGVYSFSLPFTSAENGPVVGEAWLEDAGTQYYTQVVFLNSTTTVTSVGTATGFVAANDPFTWAVNDSINLCGWFMKA